MFCSRKCYFLQFQFFSDDLLFFRDRVSPSTHLIISLKLIFKSVLEI